MKNVVAFNLNGELCVMPTELGWRGKSFAHTGRVMRIVLLNKLHCMHNNKPNSLRQPNKRISKYNNLLFAGSMPSCSKYGFNRGAKTIGTYDTCAD